MFVEEVVEVKAVGLYFWINSEEPVSEPSRSVGLTPGLFGFDIMESSVLEPRIQVVRQSIQFFS